MIKPYLEAGALLGAASLTAAILANAGFRPQSQLFGRTLIAGPDPCEVALTYDDGPNDRSTEPLLDLLAEHNVKATFFMIGRFVQQRADLARKVHAAGHLVANHTMTHPWLAWQPAGRIREELHGCQDTLQNAIGAPVRFFRPPHGARRPAVMRIAAELRLTTVQWNAMGNDWEPSGPDRILSLLDADIRRIRGRRAANILLHDGGDHAMGADRTQTIAATRILLDRFRTQGIRPVRIDAWAQASPNERFG